MQQHGKTGIARDLTVWLVVGYIILAAPLAFLGYYKSTTDNERLLKEELNSLCSKFSTVLREPVWNVDEDAIMAYFRSYRIPETLVYVRVLTQYGDPICSFSVYDETNIQLCRQRVTKNKEEIGIVEVAVSRERIDNHKKQVAMMCLASTLLVAASIALLSSIIIKILLGRPMDKIGKRLRIIAAGDYLAKIPPHRYREINKINQEVNSMAVQIASRVAARGGARSAVRDRVRDPECGPCETRHWHSRCARRRPAHCAARLPTCPRSCRHRSRGPRRRRPARQ